MAARSIAAGDDPLTLHEAADRLGVHYMTVYRHVRLGMLPARKVGGSWRIDPADVTTIQRAGDPTRPSAPGAATTPSVASKTRRRVPWAGRLRQRMLAGDVTGSWEVVEAAMASGVEPQDVYVEILGPALHGIGTAWRRGEIGIAEEHFASGVAMSIIGRMGPRFHRRGRHRGAVLVALPAGERHGLGVAMLGDILAQAGYEVFNLGQDTPSAALAAAISGRDDLRAIVISVVDSSHLSAASRLVAAARQTEPALPIVAGGSAVPDRATALRLGADAWEADPRRLAGLIAELSVR